MGEHRKYIDRINLCMNQIDGLYYMAARKMGIKDNTLILFYVLNDRKPHTQKEICEEWLIPRTTINTIVRSIPHKSDNHPSHVCRPHGFLHRFPPSCRAR